MQRSITCYNINDHNLTHCGAANRLMTGLDLAIPRGFPLTAIASFASSERLDLAGSGPGDGGGSDLL
jgi:hypothetical protein